ncbi:MAG: hypothetical protein ACOYK8_04100 [Alphaproteobacteria bacterium]
MKAIAALIFLLLTLAFAQAQAADNPPEELVVSLELDGNILSDDLLILQTEHDLLLPVVAIADLLAFSAKLIEERELVDGWLLEESRRFSINRLQGIAEANGKKANFTKSESLLQGHDLYIPAAALEKIWPLHFHLNLRTSTLQIEAIETLPLQAKLKREAKRGGLQRARVKKKSYEETPIPYEPYAWPVMDFSSNILRKSRGNPETSYNVNWAGDFLYTTMEGFISGKPDEGVTDLRLTLSRQHSNGHALGFETGHSGWPDGIKLAQLGDITMPGVNLIANPRLERGIVLSDSPITQRFDFDKRTIQGQAPPGYEAELYRGDQLLDFQTVGNNGQYAFVDVLLTTGANPFKVILYGPQGQKIERGDTVYIGDGLLPTGEQHTTLTLTQTGKSMAQLLGVGTGNSFPRREISALLQHDRGIFEDVTWSMSVGRLPDRQSLLPKVESQFLLPRPDLGVGQENDRLAQITEAQMKSFAVTGLRAALLGSYVRADHYWQEGGGKANEFGLVTGIDNLSINLSYATLDNLTTAISNQGNLPFDERLRGRVGLSVPPLWFLPRFDGDVFYDGRYGKLGYRNEQINKRFSTKIGGIRLINNWSAQREISDVAEGSWNKQYNLDASWHIGRYDQLTSIQYYITPVSHLGQVSHTTTLWQSEHGRLEAAIERQFYPKTTNAYTASWSQDWAHVNTGLQARYDTSTGTTLLASLGVAIAPLADQSLYVSPKPLSSSGIVQPEYHLLADDKAKPLASIRTLVNDQPTPNLTDKTGKTLLTGLPVGDATQFSPDTASFDDAFWTSTQKGKALGLRKGKPTKVAFDITETGEIEGKVMFEPAASEENLTPKPRALPRVNVQIEGMGLKKIIRSSFDGAFYANQLPPGEYVISLASEQVGSLAALKAENSINATITKSDLSVYDVELKVK